MTDLAANILAVLPQTQCTRCGYPDCAAYAQAVASGAADINQCPPGGVEGINRIEAATGRPAKALNPEHGVEGPRSMVYIDEAWCIGCTLCIKACPVDAIMGTNKLMHTVIESYCTGCELCLPVCPVDCILVENASGSASGWAAWSQPRADLARDRYAFNSFRRKRDEAENDKRLETKALLKLSDLSHHSQHKDPAVLDQKRAVIEAALARARAKQQRLTPPAPKTP
ncbi:MAG: electron transport complex subunit RsxB [Comamonadaceae bacterium]|nr:electron transport complex subunit RsxB [Comamonadaceae bacterium]